MDCLRHWARRLALGLLALLAMITVASISYNVATNGRERPARALYPGPFIPVDGTLVAYRQWGNTGTPIVLVGGFVEPSWVWHRLGTLLGRHHRVYAIDLPPFGYTQRTGHYTLASWVSLLRGFERELRIVRPIVVGHSLGAAVAVADALRHPGEAAGIVLLDGDALAAGGGAGWLTHLLINPYYTSVFRIATGADWLVRRALHSAYGPDAPPLDRSVLQEWERPFRVQSTQGAFKTLLSYGIQGFQLAELAAVRVPSIVVWGANDTVDSISAGRHTAAVLHAPFVLVPAAGHLSMLGKPTFVAAALNRFAARATPTTAAAHDLSRCAPARAAASVTRSGTCVVGTDRADSIVATPAGNVIYGWAGDDRLTGGFGNDRIFAGSGNDIVHGGAGDDLIDPALGNDRVYGGSGNDLIKTRGGERDWISCGPGIDRAEVDKQDVVAADCEKVVIARGYVSQV